MQLSLSLEKYPVSRFNICSLNSEPIKRVSQVKDLGDIFDSNLSFNAHADYIINSCDRFLGFFCKMCIDYHDETAIRAVYYSSITVN